ncbi:MAG: response regulator [Gemmatimonadetes bacterium]|nr:response regulator [Gemmatimonadota bacterium]
MRVYPDSSSFPQLYRSGAFTQLRLTAVESDAMSEGDAGQAGVRRVLLVDDNADMRSFIRGIVESVPSLVHECADGEGAVSAYAAVRPDWVLMDVELGGMDGIAATRAIRTIDADAHVVIVTAHAEPEYRRAAADAGACAFVLKENLLDLPGILDGTLPLGEPEAR